MGTADDDPGDIFDRDRGWAKLRRYDDLIPAAAPQTNAYSRASRDLQALPSQLICGYNRKNQRIQWQLHFANTNSSSLSLQQRFLLASLLFSLQGLDDSPGQLGTQNVASLVKVLGSLGLAMQLTHMYGNLYHCVEDKADTKLDWQGRPIRAGG
jgi:hypothetical protein